MIAVAYLFGTVAVITAALLWRAIVLLERARFDRDENAAEVDRLEKALGATSASNVRLKLSHDTAVFIADCAIDNTRDLYDQSRILPSVADAADLVVPTWPMGDAPLHEAAWLEVYAS